MTPASKLVVDSWAWLELFSGSERGRKVDELLAAGEAFTSVVSLSEVVSVSARRGRPTDDKVAVIRSQSRVMAPSYDDAVEVGHLHAVTKKQSPNFSLSDAFVLQLAKKLGAKVLTGDLDFQGVKDAVLVK